MFSADEYIQRIGESEHGAARLAIIADAVREADAAGAHNWRFYFRFEAIRESIFYDDAFRAILSFPEMLQVFDEHPELEDEFADDMLSAFKWILENAVKFHQVSREQIDRYYDEYEKRCKAYGVSMRVYHMKRCNYLLSVDQEAARREYDAFHRCKRDGYSDCLACETHFDMEVALKLGDEEAALRIAQPILEGDLTCGEIPHWTYETLTAHYLYGGDLEEASYFGELCERCTRGEPEFLAASGTLLSLYSATDPGRGWNLFKQCVPQFAASKNPQDRMWFADGASRLLLSIVQANGEDDMSQAKVLRHLPVRFMDKGCSLREVQAYFKEFALDAARKLDARDGTEYHITKLSREIVPAVPENGVTLEKKRPAHGITRRLPCVLMPCLPVGTEVSYAQMEQRVRDAVPEGAVLLSTSVDEEGLFLSFERGKRVYDYMLTVVTTPEGPPCNPVADLTDEDCEAMLQNEQRYIFRAPIGEASLLDYSYAMQLILTLLPEQIGVIDVLNHHAYSRDWVRFKGTYENAVMPNDLFGLYLSGDQERDEVWMTTMGLNMLGMRDIEVIGANTRNYSMFADILDHVAAQAVTYGMLPDEGEGFGVIYIDEASYECTWKRVPDDLDPASVAAHVERDGSSALLCLDTDDGITPLPACKVLQTAGEISYPRVNSDFRRRVSLSKRTFPLFREALQKPFVRAAVQAEFHLTQEAAKQYGYGIELIWAEIVSVQDGVIRAAVRETSEALPDLHEDDIVEITEQNTAIWYIQPEGFEEPVTMQEAYLLMKEAKA